MYFQHKRILIAISLKMYSEIGQKNGFGRPIVEIGQKMANGQLLFVCVCVCVLEV